MKLHNATDRIEKEIVLRAPQSRVWRALANAEEFGAWFGMKLEGDFAPGGSVHGQITLPAIDQGTTKSPTRRLVPRPGCHTPGLPTPANPAVTSRAEPTPL